MPLAKDLLHPPHHEEKRRHKLKRLQHPNSYFMDVKCPGCYRFTHYQQTDCHTLKANSQPTNWLQDLHLAFIGVTIIEFSRTPLC